MSIINIIIIHMNVQLKIIIRKIKTTWSHPSFSDHSRFKEHAWKTANPVHIPPLKPRPLNYELNKNHPPPKRSFLQTFIHFHRFSCEKFLLGISSKCQVSPTPCRKAGGPARHRKNPPFLRLAVS